MNVHELRKYHMLARVQRFGATHRDAFSAVPLATQAFAAVDIGILAVHGHATRQASVQHDARVQTLAKADARHALLDQLRAIGRTARALALDTKGLDLRFRLPREPRDLLLASAARVIATHARTLEAQFVAHAMPVTFVADLIAAIDGFETVTIGRHSITRAHVEARVGIEQATAAAYLAVRRLDAIVHNRFRCDAAALEAWRCARRVERSQALAARRFVPAIAVPQRKTIAVAQQRRSVADEAGEQARHRDPSRNA